jgi:glutamate N-acetyltransferase/amino-acid N-acetyltransferase
VKNEKKTIYFPRGFLFAAGEAGLRTHGHGPDVGLIYSTVPARVGALFTSNRVKAAPVELSQEHLRQSHHVAQAIVVNAGNANCATGARGHRAARQCSAEAARILNIPPGRILLASTGVIGLPLDPRPITELLPALARRLRPQGYDAVSRAILTTDTRPKVVSRRISLSGRSIHVLGFSKGAGMIYPRLATMLGFLFTDAAVEPRFLQAAVRRLCDLSFNRISVDGDTSTNDTVFLMANGLAGNPPLQEKSPGAPEFFQALTEVAQQLAIEMVRDGEGARKLVEIRVEGAASEKDASAIARSIGLSSLVKTALAGADPNWGRVLSAAGNAGADFDPGLVDIRLAGVLVCRRGKAAKYNERALQRKLRAGEVLIRVVLREGTSDAVFWTCDFTEKYVRINASYRT